MSPMRYELGFISQETAFFIVTAMKTSNLTKRILIESVSGCGLDSTGSGWGSLSDFCERGNELLRHFSISCATMSLSRLSVPCSVKA
jgi:hypothetical protein